MKSLPVITVITRKGELVNSSPKNPTGKLDLSMVVGTKRDQVHIDVLNGIDI